MLGGDLEEERIKNREYWFIACIPYIIVVD